jgi:hypothetical protein
LTQASEFPSKSRGGAPEIYFDQKAKIAAR